MIYGKTDGLSRQILSRLEELYDMSVEDWDFCQKNWCFFFVK